MAEYPDDYWVKAAQYTKNVYRDVYPAVDPSRPELSMAGKVIIVTGASRGIGARGIAPAFAKAGAKAIVLVARDLSKLEGVAREIHAINPAVRCLCVPTDIADPESVRRLFAKVKEQFGYADVCVNNAALFQGWGTIRDVDPAAWIRDFHTNTVGTFLMCNAYLKSLPVSGPPSHGTLINIASCVSTGNWHGMTGYAISKLVTLQLAAAAHNEMAATSTGGFPISGTPGRVTAIALHPGLVNTDMMVDSYERFAQDTPQLAGGVCVWLATERARFLGGRYVECHWDVDELEARRDEILASDDLMIKISGPLGPKYFGPGADGDVAVSAKATTKSQPEKSGAKVAIAEVAAGAVAGKRLSSTVPGWRRLGSLMNMFKV